MAEPPVPAPASAGFKLKLKLGGSSIGTAGSARPVSSSNDASTSRSNGSPSIATSTSITQEPPPAPSQADVSMDVQSLGEPDDLYMDASSIPDDGDDGDFTVGTSKKSKAKRASNTPTLTYSAAQDAQAYPTGVSPDLDANQIGAASSYSYPGPSLLAPPPAKKRKAPTANPGAGRGWRKGLKNSEKQDGVPLSLAGKAPGDLPPQVAAGPSKRRKTAVNMAEDGAEDDMDDDFVPNMVAPGAIATSDKWQNGLPGGNEQSRQTAAMAAAVNKLFPVGPPPKTGSGFLPSQPLDKKTPKVRSWKKARREIVGPGGNVFSVPIWTGASESPYASYMIEHPRPPPVDKKALAASVVANEIGSPMPEGSYAGSDGTPGDGAAAPAKRRKRLPGEPKRKPGPPKKVKAPAEGIAPVSAPVAPAPSVVDASVAQPAVGPSAPY